MGVVSYYRDMFPRRSHTLAPLTKITSNKRKFKWTKVGQDAFDKINRAMACNNLLTYPVFNERFKIHTDDSTFQLGALITQKGKQIAIYCRKLNGAQ